MINLDPAAATAAPSALGGVPDAAAGGDFLAMLAGIVGNVTSAASTDGDGVLLPGSPLLHTDGSATGDLVADLAAELGTILDADTVGDGEATDGTEAAFPWPTVQALAAMFAQPTGAAAADPPATPSATGVPAAVTGAAADATQTVVGLAGQLTAMSGAAPAGDAATVAVMAGAVADTAAAAAGGAPAAEVAPTDRATTSARTAATPSVGAGTDAADATSVLEAAADADAGEPRRAEAPRGGPDAGFRPADSATGDSLADHVPASGEVRDTAGTVRDRGQSTSTAAGVARVLDAIEALEKAPPPRQVTLELGDVRVRVAVEDGAVRMQLLGEQRDAGREFLRAADEALRERGFEMAGEGRGDARDRDADQQRPDLAPPRPDRGFGRGTRTTDATTSGVRTGIHL